MREYFFKYRVNIYIADDIFLQTAKIFLVSNGKYFLLFFGDTRIIFFLSIFVVGYMHFRQENREPWILLVESPRVHGNNDNILSVSGMTEGRTTGRKEEDALSVPLEPERKLYNNCGSTRNFGAPLPLTTSDSTSLVKTFKTSTDDANYASASGERGKNETQPVGR